MAEWATCTCLIGEDEYHRMVALRDSRRLRRAGFGSVVLGVLLTIAGAVMFGSAGMIAALIALTGILFAAMGAYVLATGHAVGGASVHAGQARAFLARHGAVGEPPRYRQSVVVGSEGICIAYGMDGAHKLQMTSKLIPWNEWKAVRSTPDAVFIERDVHQGGISDLFGFNYLLRMAERDRFEDAFLPASAIEGMAPGELADRSQAMIASKR